MIPATPLEQYLLAQVPSGTEVPVYGSAAFTAAEDVHVRAASVIRAARSWRLHTDPEVIAAELRIEIEQGRAALRRASIDVSLAHDWDAESRRLSWAELQARRAS